MAELPEAIIEDLRMLIVKRTREAISGVLQLVDTDKERVDLSSSAAAVAFGVLARCIQYRMTEQNGETPPIADCFKGATEVVGNLGIEHSDQIEAKTKRGETFNAGRTG